MIIIIANEKNNFDVSIGWYVIEGTKDLADAEQQIRESFPENVETAKKLGYTKFRQDNRGIVNGNVTNLFF